MKDSVDIRRLAIVLKHANSAPPSNDCQREAFFALKSAICENYGAYDGDDIQHITRPCWGYRYIPCDDDCPKCGGSGIYSEKWVILKRWKIGGFVFHKPDRTIAGSLQPATINGLIRHKRSKLATAAQRVLNMAFGFSGGVLFWGSYADCWKMPDAELRRFKVVMCFLFGIQRQRWPGIRLRFGDMDDALRRYRTEMIPF